MFLLQTPPPAPAARPAVPLAEARARAAALEQARDWNGLADYMETLDPRSRGILVEAWLRALRNADRPDRLLQVCDAVIPQLEPTGKPVLSTPRLYRALALTRLGRHADAMAAHAENGRLGDPAGLRNACVEAQAGSDWRMLEALATELQEKTPFKKEGATWHGEALFRQGRLDEAEAQFRTCTQTDPGQAYGWAMLGACLAARRACAEAIEALDRAIAADPAKVEPYFNRALAKFGLKRYAEGRDDLLKARALQPDDPAVRAQVEENLRMAEKYLRSQAAPGPKSKGN